MAKNRITVAYRWFSIFMFCAILPSIVLLSTTILLTLELLGPGWPESVAGLSGVLSFVLSGVALAFSWILLYRSWQVIQEDTHITPGKAVGYCFIPVFNLYWIYIAFFGLARHLNRHIRKLDVSVKPVPTIAALVFCSWLLISFLTLRILHDPMYNSDLLPVIIVAFLIVIYFLLLWVLMASFARVCSSIIDAHHSSI